MLTNRPLPSDHESRMRRAMLALDGLSVGDAFGQQFFSPGVREWSLSTKQAPRGPWSYTDDTVMALAICEVLTHRQGIDQDLLAARFAERFIAEPSRGYGSGAQELLRKIAAGADWRQAAPAMFGGTGSLGNGSAMRVAPIGAYFADDVDLAVSHAKASAHITHAHPEGVAGAVAIAVASAWSCRNSGSPELSGTAMLQAVLERTPAGATRRGIEQALDTPLDEWEYTAANLLGNGSRITVPDTVPFCLWCAAAHLNSYSDALWAAMHVEGDIDTNCAIIGGIVASAVGRSGIPADWLRAREGLILEHDWQTS